MRRTILQSTGRAIWRRLPRILLRTVPLARRLQRRMSGRPRQRASRFDGASARRCERALPWIARSFVFVAVAHERAQSLVSRAPSEGCVVFGIRTAAIDAEGAHFVKNTHRNHCTLAFALVAATVGCRPSRGAQAPNRTSASAAGSDVASPNPSADASPAAAADASNVESVRVCAEGEAPAPELAPTPDRFAWRVDESAASDGQPAPLVATCQRLSSAADRARATIGATLPADSSVRPMFAELGRCHCAGRGAWVLDAGRAGAHRPRERDRRARGRDRLDRELREGRRNGASLAAPRRAALGRRVDRDRSMDARKSSSARSATRLRPGRRASGSKAAAKRRFGQRAGATRARAPKPSSA